MTTPTLDDVLGMTAEDVPDLAAEVATLLRFRESARIGQAQEARTRDEMLAVAAHNRGLPKRARIGY